MRHCKCCSSYEHDYYCPETLPLPLVLASYSTEPFGNRSARAQKFRYATSGLPDSAKWISSLSRHSAHAVRMCESAPVIYALISAKVGMRQLADQLERARDVRTWLRRNDWPASFIKLSFHSACLLRGCTDILSKAPPTVLSQSIPVVRQERWAGFIGDYLRRRDSGRIPIEYILSRALDLLDVFGDARHFIDFLNDSGVALDLRWGNSRLRRELVEWERTFALRKLEAERKRIEIIDGCPERHEVQGFEFIALNSEAALVAEGAAMRHCVGGGHYVWQVKGKRSVIYAVQNKSERGTLQIAPGLSGMEILQIKGPFNRCVSADMTAAATAFCKMVSTGMAQGLAA